MGLAFEIQRALDGAFAPTDLVIVNDSHRHAGHAGDDGSGESHWSVTIAAPAFGPMTRIERHRAIHSALGPRHHGAASCIGTDC